MIRRLRNMTKIAVFFITCLTMNATQGNPVLVGMGDSIGEGVQGADAAWQTQVFSYLNFLGFSMGAGNSLPLIQSNIFGAVGNTENRSRIEPDIISNNIAVSGATLHSLLNSAADATSPTLIDSELDLVLFPRQQSQIEFVEASLPAMVVCWIGNNDVLSAATSFSKLDATQMTSVKDFERDYTELVDRLGALVTSRNTKVVFANIPNVTDIGFLVDSERAADITGFPVNLPAGHFTSLIGALLMNIAGNDNLISSPDWVLDAAEVTLVLQRTQAFNAIIDEQAARIAMPVVDVNARFALYVNNPPKVLGIELTNKMMGGMFSLDGVHPSNIGHLLIANEFIDTMNQSFGMNLPKFSQHLLNVVFLLDPGIDKDQDGKSQGRLGVGIIETLAFLFGFTGDPNDLDPTVN